MENHVSKEGFTKTKILNGKYRYKNFGILLLAFLNNVLIGGVSFNLSIYHEAFLDEFQQSNSITSLASSIQLLTFIGSSMFASLVINWTSCRIALILGGCMSGVGLTLCFFVSNIYQLYVTYGLLTGTGLSFCYTANLVFMGDCFAGKKFTAVLGVAASGITVGQFLYPYISMFLLDKYGWRGAILCTGAITMNICWMAGLFRPLKEYVVTEPAIIPGNEKKKFVYGSSNTIQIMSKSLSNLHLSSSMMQMSLKNEQEPPIKQSKKAFDWDIFKNLSFIIVTLNNVLFLFASSILYVFIMPFAQSQGHTMEHAAILASILGPSGAAGRLLLGLLASYHKVDTLLLYAFSFVAAGIPLVIYPLVGSVLHLLYAATAVCGFFLGAWGSIWPQILAIAVGTSKLSSAVGGCLFFASFGSALGPPVAGWLFDQLGSYNVPLYISGSAIILSGLIELIPWMRDKKKWLAIHRHHRAIQGEIHGI